MSLGHYNSLSAPGPLSFMLHLPRTPFFLLFTWLTFSSVSGSQTISSEVSTPNTLLEKKYKCKVRKKSFADKSCG